MSIRPGDHPSAPKRSSRLLDGLADLQEAWRVNGFRGVSQTAAGYARWRLSGATVEGSDESERVKHRENLQLIRSMRREPFMRLVREAQDEVAAVSDSHYIEEYRSTEIHYWAPIARWLYERAEDTGAARVLDIGCGSGTLAVYMSRIFGSPTSCTDMLTRQATAALSALGTISFRPCNIELDPVPFQGPFDVIVFTEVLEHLNFNPVPTLVKIRQALAADGRIYLSTPDAAEWGTVTEYYPSLESMPTPAEGQREIREGMRTYVDDHIWQYSQSELLDVIDRAGLVIVRQEFSPGVLNRHFNFELASSGSA